MKLRITKDETFYKRGVTFVFEITHLSNLNKYLENKINAITKLY
jgi:hypothetical protein